MMKGGDDDDDDDDPRFSADPEEAKHLRKWGRGASVKLEKNYA